ncbi:MAG: homoserine dehydrogenase [Candidatus Lokiarchaeota archaeon]|nr:homoserine dehydrogenase [Candidatus Lokiarchaeota archaeon]
MVMITTKIGLIGKGNVGSSFLKLVQDKKEILKTKFDLHLKIVFICEYDGALVANEGLNISQIIEKEKNFRQLNHWNNGLDARTLISQEIVDIIIDTTPTNPDTGEPALTHIIEALNHGIHVVSSNKGPFYLKYNYLKKLAKEKTCLMRYEATVASCVPILSIKDNLIGNEITGIKAILNGTSNYILSRMTSEGIHFDIALKEAQELGYAEADPTLDIEGFDAAGKLVILANELMGWSKKIDDVNIKGITEITPQAIELAKADGYIIKHLAIVEKGKLTVEPRLIEGYSPLNISGTLNVIELQTKHAGPIVLSGRGAGGFEAASAILNDLLEIIKNCNL